MTDWWRCPNDPRCPHPGVVHDIYDWDDPKPMCCVDGCRCGHAADCQIRTPPPAGFPFDCFSCNCKRSARGDDAISERTRRCDGLCVSAADIGVGGTDAVAYPHPGCPLHSPNQTCGCGQPDRCLSPTHGQVSHAEARRIRNSQRPT